MLLIMTDVGVICNDGSGASKITHLRISMAEWKECDGEDCEFVDEQRLQTMGSTGKQRLHKYLHG